MRQSNLLDRLLLQFQTVVNIVVRRLPSKVSVDSENMRIGNWAMESGMGCDGCRYENGNR